MKLFIPRLLRRTKALLAMTNTFGSFHQFIVGLAMIGLACNLYAATAIYNFNSKQDEQRFYQLTTELRCLVCQNQNLLESNAGLAKDLRDNIYTQMNQGKSDQEIIRYLVARYGNFILYQPPFNPATIALWLGPIMTLIAGLSFLIFYLRKNKTI